jgi:aldehyde dehydrogenase (NAD+)
MVDLTILERQRAFFNSGGTRSVTFRKERLRNLKEAIKAHENDIYEALAKDLGKGTMESFYTEVAYCLNEIEFTLRHLDRWVRPKKAFVPLAYFPSSAGVYPEPLGVALIMAPWNYPFELVISALVGAVSAGDCAIIKPSSLAAETAMILEKILAEAFEPEHVSVMRISSKETGALLKEKFDMIFYTGSTRVGRIVMKAAAENLTPVVLELGGKSPCIVDASADLEVAAARIAWGKFMNSGQTCVAPDYVVAHSSVKTDLIKMFKKKLREFYGENPRLSVDYSRIIDKSHFDRLVSLLGSGGDIAVGGEYNADDLYIAPTVMDNVTWESKIMEDEIFGPILPVLEYETLNEIIGKIKERPKPLALYIFSEYEYVSEKILRNLSSGGACVNHTLLHLMPNGLPFGGVGESGMGAYHGKASFDVFSHHRSIFRKSLSHDSRSLYPPYDRITPFWRRVARFFS